MAIERVLIEPEKYPFAGFGENPVREVRCPVSPEFGDDENIRIVTTTVPAGGVAEGHIHPDADEYIRFDIPGEAEVDGVVYQVPAGGVIHARKGIVHECRNTDPERTLNLYCVFTPAFEPYGAYPELLEATKKFIEKKESEK